MKHEDITKEYVKANIYTTNEASEFIGVTRQMLINYVNQGKLEPLKLMSNGPVFYKPDLVKLNEERYKERKIVNSKPERKIYGKGNTRESLEWFNKIVLEKDKVASVRLYFEEEEAIQDGFYCMSESGYSDLPIPVQGPNCIIKYKSGDEVWFGGFNCGYMGTGPNGSVKILTELGVDEKMSKELYGASVIEFYKDDEAWNYQIIRLRELETKNNMFHMQKISSDYYFYDGNLVLAFRNSGTLFRFSDEVPEEFIEINNTFIPKPVSAEILTKEYAINSGHYVINFGQQTLFQIVLKDMSGKEIWMPCVVEENVPVTRQDNIKEILRKFGIEISFKQSMKEEVKYWMNIQPRIENKTVYNKE